MKQKQKLFIYDRKEMTVLILLGVTLSVFAFTLGVHLGKSVTTTTQPLIATAPSSLTTQPDLTPSADKLSDQAEGAQQAADEALSQALHDEVARTGTKLDQHRQLELPHQTKAKNAGATTAEAPKKETTVPLESVETAHAAALAHRFAIQIGSFPSATEAEAELLSYSSSGLKPYLRSADVPLIGKRYRIFLGEYKNKDEAEKAGEQFRSQHLIKSFIVAKITG